jgi:GT2 family glycosyltransferase
MLSIITITFNNFNELIRTLNSIPISDSIESVVVNGGDCSKTKDFLKCYRGKSVSEKDDGIADAFNKGTKLSSGEYIMFLNSGDVLLEKSYPEKAIKILDNNNEYDFTHSNLIFVDENSNELFMRPQMKSLGRGMPYLHPTMIVKKEVFTKTGLFDKNIKVAMDFDWVIKLVKNNFKGFYLNEGAVVRMDGKGKSVVEESKAIKECFTILKAHNYFTLKNIIGYVVRYALYLGRVFLVKAGLKKQLTSMKKIKHSR